MFAVPEVAPNGQQAGQTQTQQEVIASVQALHKVIAGQATAENGDASARQFAGANARDKSMRTPVKDEEKRADATEKPDKGSSDQSAQARSIVEAQEASATDNKITAAFQARHGISDLLSVIRDPEDRMLPQAPAPES